MLIFKKHLLEFKNQKKIYKEKLHVLRVREAESSATATMKHAQGKTD